MRRVLLWVSVYQIVKRTEQRTPGTSIEHYVMKWDVTIWCNKKLTLSEGTCPDTSCIPVRIPFKMIGSIVIDLIHVTYSHFVPLDDWYLAYVYRYSSPLDLLGTSLKVHQALINGE